MREIKFRGRDHIGIWREGYLIEFFGEKKRLFAIDYCNEYSSEGQSLNVFAVDEKTIGQFAGLKDRGGNDICEGDIVARYVSQSGDGISANLIIRFHQGRFFGSVTEHTAQYDIYGLCYQCAVIGNIHDNPEMIGGDI